jgi:tetratricopeptide (TPR) repeat protein
MIKALRAITQAQDARRGGNRHSKALARAMRAMQEAGDFMPRGARLEGELDLAQIVSGHRTEALKGVCVNHLTPITVQQKYLEYAQEQFAQACGDVSAASSALYGLARIYTAMEDAQVDAQMLCLPKAVTLHQAALLVDAANANAANELGVLLARFGQLEDAQRVLQHALSIRPAPEMWRNLAVVHQRLGQYELARQANEQSLRMASRPGGTTYSGSAHIRWVDPQTFSAASPGAWQ